MSHRRTFAQRLAAAVCLLALILIYAPITTAACLAATGACCTGEECPIHGHHGSTTHQDHAAMECEHHGAATLSACTMSCCPEAPALLLHALLFVAPAIAASNHLMPLSSASVSAPAVQTSPSFPPNAPPPKSLAV